jgi:hypothetical protein
MNGALLVIVIIEIILVLTKCLVDYVCKEKIIELGVYCMA